MIDCRLRNWESILAIFGGILTFVVLSLPHLGDPLIVDEAIFGSTIRSLAEDGIPHYYAGEAVGWKAGLWHPPTYIYYVSVWFSTLGSSSLVARLATIVFSVLTIPAIAWLTLAISDAIGENGQKIAVFSAIAIYVTSPLVIQNGTLVDIDGSVLALAVTLFVAWVIRTFGRKSSNWPRELGLLGVWVACIAWIKFGVLPVLLFSTVVYVGYQRGTRRCFHVCVAAVGGLLAFTASWWVLSSLLDLSFIAPFAHNFGSLFSGGGEISKQKRLLLSAWGLYTEIAWFSPFLFGLSALAMVGPRKRIRIAPVFVFGIVALTILQYAVLAKVPYGFPKYLGIATPLASALGGVVITEIRGAVIKTRTWVAFTIALTGVAIGMFLFGDPYLVPFNRGYTSVFKDTALTVGVVLGLTVATTVALYQARWTPNRRHLLVAILLILLLGTNVGVLTHQTNSDYSTRYFYGTEETNDAISATEEAYEDLPDNRRSEAVVPVDFGFYLDGTFHTVKRYDVSMLESQNPPLVVLRTQKYYQAESQLVDWLEDSPKYKASRHGSYIIFVRAV